MPTKTTDAGVAYEVTAKSFIWHPEDDNGKRDGELATIELPLRLKVKLIRTLSGNLDADEMFDLLGTIVPSQTDVLDEMDLNDFTMMFLTWQQEYSALTGATLGESQR